VLHAKGLSNVDFYNAIVHCFRGKQFESESFLHWSGIYPEIVVANNFCYKSLIKSCSGSNFSNFIFF
jgi:hypothetical protein